MSTTSVNESGVIINEAEEFDTVDDIIDFVAQHIHEWVNHQVLWDMTLFDFLSIDSQVISYIIRKAAPLSEKRSGLKTAILVESDLGFGMMRMLEMMGDEDIKMDIGVFRNRDEALNWLYR